MNIIQQIFKDHGNAYLDAFWGKVPYSHCKALRAILKCRSGLCGQHVFKCPNCGESVLANSSCGDRHCPVCQNEKARQWIQLQEEKLLPCNYFLATFTVPEQLNRVAKSNQRKVYAALFKCASESLKSLQADKRFVGCTVSGFFGVLHTWGRQMQYHTHLHFVIPGGGLSKDRTRWINARENFLVHVRALSKMFRGKMRAAFAEAGLLTHIPPEVWKQDWVVHCKSVGNGRAVMKYLGAYVFRVAISASRITAYDGENVSFEYTKSGSNRRRGITLHVFEFIRRYLQHVLPPGFMKMRHYGFMSPNFGMCLQRIKELICRLYELLRDLPAGNRETAPRPLVCPSCRTPMEWSHFLPPLRRGAAP